MYDYVVTVGLCVFKEGADTSISAMVEDLNWCCLCDEVYPVPHDPEIDRKDWAIENWGTKRGCFDTLVRCADEDMPLEAPVIISFLTVGTPPNERIMDLIGKWLREKYQVIHVSWIVYNPQAETPEVTS